MASDLDVNASVGVENPLWVALRVRDLKKVQVLLEMGANPNVLVENKTLCDWILSVVGGGDANQIYVLLWNAVASAGGYIKAFSSKVGQVDEAKPAKSIQELRQIATRSLSLFDLIYDGKFGEVTAIVKRGGCNLDAIDVRGHQKNNLLMATLSQPGVTEKEVMGLAAALTRGGIELNYKNAQNDTALSVAITNSFFNIANALLIFGADPNIGNTLENFLEMENNFKRKGYHTELAFNLRKAGLDVSRNRRMSEYINSHSGTAPSRWKNNSIDVISGKKSRVPVAEIESDS